MSEYIRVYLQPLPAHLRGFCVKKDDWYTIIINESLSQSERLKTFAHEMRHIERDDFYSEEPVDVIERNCHEIA